MLDSPHLHFTCTISTFFFFIAKWMVEFRTEIKSKTREIEKLEQSHPNGGESSVCMEWHSEGQKELDDSSSKGEQNCAPQFYLSRMINLTPHQTPQANKTSEQTNKQHRTGKVVCICIHARTHVCKCRNEVLNWIVMRYMHVANNGAVAAAAALSSSSLQQQTHTHNQSKRLH